MALTIRFAALFAAALLTIPGIAAAGDDEYRVRVPLAGETPASGKADYRERDTKGVVQKRFSVEIEDAPANTSYQVAVNGVAVGVITTDDFGIGELQFRTAAFIDSPGDGLPIPADFPRITGETVITIGSLLESGAAGAGDDTGADDSGGRRLLGDLNDDNVVNELDLRILLDNFTRASDDKPEDESGDDGNNQRRRGRRGMMPVG